MIIAEINKEKLKEQRLNFIRTHQEAFDVDPIYPLQLFEDFVMGVAGDCTLEASCKVELDK
ncbi:MAG: anacyclamide synthesis protein AcyF, partial [Symploca sp. SIO1B1]|nr:anacyclamide synthesis protein AcyF [Symploca sp. SIO1B1]